MDWIYAALFSALKAFYIEPIIYPRHVHTGESRPLRQPQDPLTFTRGSVGAVSCPTADLEGGGLEPPILQLLDNTLYDLSHGRGQLC